MTTNELDIVKKHEAELKRTYIWTIRMFTLIGVVFGILIGVNL